MSIDVERGESPMSENKLTTPACSSISGAQRRRLLIPVDYFREEQTGNKQKKLSAD